MSARFFLRMMWRELRGAPVRVAFFTLCLAIAVGALVAVAAVGSSVELGMRARARELLGGDLALESRRKLPELDELLPSSLREAPRVRVALLASMVRGDAGKSRLAEVKAIEARGGRYPLAGTLETAPVTDVAALPDDAALVAPELLEELGLTLGSRLHVGSADYRVVGTVIREPDPRGFVFTLGPRVLMSRAGLERSELLSFGSRVLHRVVFALPGMSETRLSALKDDLAERLPSAAHVSVETRLEAQPALRSAFSQASQYLSLVALLSLLVASVGVAQIVAAWLAQTVRDTAVLRCLGVSPRQLVLLYMGHVLVLALLGSGVGALLGLLGPWLLTSFSPGLLPAELMSAGVEPWPVLRGLALGVLIPLLFSLPSLLSVHRVPPGRVLRAEAEPLPMSLPLRLGSLLLAVLGMFGAAALQTPRLDVAAYFTLALLALVLVLALVARAVLAVVAMLHGARLPAWLWHGAASLRRPGSAALGSMVALALGTCVVVSLQQIEQLIQGELASTLPTKAPGLFLLDVQPDQWDAIAALARQQGATGTDSVPVAMARLLAVDGVPTEQLVKQRPGNPNERSRAHWVLTREQRVSWAPELPRDNRIVEGALWSDAARAEMSVEVGFARDLGAELGSVLRFDLQGVPLEFVVTSLRTVQWRSFSANFFLIAEPGVLEQAPHTRLGIVHLPPAREQPLQDALAKAYPNVTVLRTRELAERALGVLGQLSLAVRILGSLAVLTGIAILVGAVVATGTRRMREAAVLHALGVRRGQVLALLAVEYALRGAVAGALGAVGGYALALGFARKALELSGLPSWRTSALAFVVVVALTVLAGLLASARALLVAPVSVLRRAL